MLAKASPGRSAASTSAAGATSCTSWLKLGDAACSAASASASCARGLGDLGVEFGRGRDLNPPGTSAPEARSAAASRWRFSSASWSPASWRRRIASPTAGPGVLAQPRGRAGDLLAGDGSLALLCGFEHLGQHGLRRPRRRGRPLRRRCPGRARPAPAAHPPSGRAAGRRRGGRRPAPASSRPCCASAGAAQQFSGGERARAGQRLAESGRGQAEPGGGVADLAASGRTRGRGAQEAGGQDRLAHALAERELRGAGDLGLAFGEPAHVAQHDRLVAAGLDQAEQGALLPIDRRPRPRSAPGC